MGKQIRFVGEGLADYLIDKGFKCHGEKIIKDLGVKYIFDDTKAVLEAIRNKYVKENNTDN